MAEVKLTAAQQAVVENRGGTLLVSAAAGSGKTKVLVDRLLKMVLSETEPRNIDDFLMITYTKAAAAELRGKILEAMQERLAEMPGNRHLQRQLTRIYLADISTVHAFCANILRENAYRLDIPADFRVGEELECMALRQRAMEQAIAAAYAAMEPDFQSFADTLGSGRDDRSLGEIVGTVYDKARSHRDPDGWLEGCADRLRQDGTDFSETPWGQVLLSDLRQFLDDAILELERACELLAADPALEAAYLPTFQKNLSDLRALRACACWDEVTALGMPDFGRLKSVRKCGDPEAKETAQFLRKHCAEELKKRLRCFRISSREALEEVAAIAPAIRGALRLAKDFGEQYRREKRRRHILDFGDLEHEALRLLYGRQGNRPTAAAREIAARYHEILVDEYQDSNEVQDAIFRAVSKDGANLFLVGDVKQSIYRFRLADPGIFLQKYKEFAFYTDAEPGEPRKILLSENFRSRGEILAAVNDVFTRAMSERTGELNYGEAEALRPGLVLPDAGYCPVELHCIREDFEGGEEEQDPKKTEVEAAFLSRRIARLLQSGAQVTDHGALRPVRPDDIAILLRSPRSAAPYYIAALQSVGIPCACDTGEDILQSTELQVLGSLLEIVENPHQDIPLLAVLASPLYGFTASELAEIRGADRKADFYDALCASETERARRFRADLERFRDVAATDGLAALFDCVLARTDALAVFRAMKREANVQTFRALLTAHAQNGGDLVSFVRTLRDLRETGLTMQSGESHGAVLLTSIHKSKGLEYPVVCLAGLSKAFNTDDLRKPVLIHPTMGVASNVTDLRLKVRYPSVAKQALARRLRQEMVSEELRVLYVAMTRAKDLLIMTYCADYLETKLKRLVNLRSCATAEQLAAQASCGGDWILAEALGRTEAGELHAIAGKPAGTAVSDSPWVIRLHSGTEILRQDAEIVETEKAPAPVPDGERLARELSYRYPHETAGRTPSKVTATQLKGRGLDDEISENAVRAAARPMQIRTPAFLQRRMSAAEAGTSVHLAMQFLRYESCGTPEGIREELKRLVREEFLTPAQAEAVDPEKIRRFFASDLGRRVLRAETVKREFKFSVLMDAGDYLPGAEGEQVLLQGVVDCCLIGDDGVTVVDFKTDRIRPGGEAQRAEYYRGQLEGYAAALSRILEKPVREKILYFFATDMAVTL